MQNKNGKHSWLIIWVGISITIAMLIALLYVLYKGYQEVQDYLEAFEGINPDMIIDNPYNN